MATSHSTPDAMSLGQAAFKQAMNNIRPHWPVTQNWEFQMKKFAACLLSLWFCSPFASANTFTTDLTDLWWNAGESGWGVTATHQQEIVFLTFFVYSPDSRPTFYVAQAAFTGQTGAGALVFSGPMYQTTGPWLGTFFNPSSVTVRQVGTATFTAFVDTATLTYSVDGVFVSKSVTRQTFRNNDLTGNYAGIFRETYSGCANPANNVTAERVMGISINNSATALSMTTNENGAICNYSGNYSQSGRMGSSSGSFACPGISGSYEMVEIEANPSGITGRLTGRDNLCSDLSGRIGLVKR